MTKDKDKISFDEAVSRAMMILSRHVGEEKAIDMGELYRRVFEKEWRNKHLDSRPVRRLIEVLRRKGVPIGSSQSGRGGGYYLCRAGSELNSFCLRIYRRPALKKLAAEARMRRTTLLEILGQMQMSLGPGTGTDARGEDDG